VAVTATDDTVTDMCWKNKCNDHIVILGSNPRLHETDRRTNN